MKNQTSSVVVANHPDGTWVLFVDRELTLASATTQDSAYCHLVTAAQALAQKLDCCVQILHVPRIDLLDTSAETPGEQMLPVLDMMGAFDPEGSIFSAISEADLINIEGIETRDGLGEHWLEDIQAKRNAGVWFPDRLTPDFNGYIITFDELCRARYQGNGKWKLPHGDGPSEKQDQLDVKFFKMAPYGI
jgi:hypothetical protein